MTKIKHLLTGIILLGCAASASAQYYEMANQLRNLISPALSGSFNYKGFVEFGGLAGFGTPRADFFSISTTQGFKYADWFFMGAGMGVDVAFAHRSQDIHEDPEEYDWMGRPSATTKAMIPVFSDFRFIIGGTSTTSPGFFIDLKLGATWLIGNSDLRLKDAHLSHGTQFYLKPAVGMRVPVDADNPSRALNFGIQYQLITSNNFYTYGSDSATLNGLGFTVAYEW